MTKEIALSPEQYNRQLLKKILLALLMGVLTVFFCVYVADGLFGIHGMKKAKEVWRNGEWDTVFWFDRDWRIGTVIFWAFIIGLPVVFSRWIGWWHTLVNYLLYPLYWLIADEVVGTSYAHLILRRGGMFSGLDRLARPFVMTVCFFVAHSLVFLAVYCIRKVRQKMKKA